MSSTSARSSIPTGHQVQPPPNTTTVTKHIDSRRANFTHFDIVKAQKVLCLDQSRLMVDVVILVNTQPGKSSGISDRVLIDYKKYVKLPNAKDAAGTFWLEIKAASKPWRHSLLSRFPFSHNQAVSGRSDAQPGCGKADVSIHGLAEPTTITVPGPSANKSSAFSYVRTHDDQPTTKIEFLRKNRGKGSEWHETKSQQSIELLDTTLFSTINAQPSSVNLYPPTRWGPDCLDSGSILSDDAQTPEEAKRARTSVLPVDIPNPSLPQHNRNETDGDSAYSCKTWSSTQSVPSSLFDFPVENGLRYHAYKAGEYFAPNDEKEQTRMARQQEAMFLASGCKRFYAPVGILQNVLDLGAGTGWWCEEMGDAYPTAVVVGVDLSLIAPKMVPPNVQHEIDDVEHEWTWPKNFFDLIHSGSMLFGSIADVPSYFKQAFQHSKPGGFLEVHELSMDIKDNHNEPIPNHAPMKLWHKYMCDGIGSIGRKGRRLDHELEDVTSMMSNAGFINVESRTFKIPIGPWAKDHVLKRAGYWQQKALVDGIEGLTMAVFTRSLGWKRNEVEVLLAKARNDAQTAHRYFQGYVLWGQKPAEV